MNTQLNIAKKEKAIELMKRLDIYKPYIKGFRESDSLCRNARIYSVRRMLLLPHRIGLSRRMGRLNER